MNLRDTALNIINASEGIKHTDLAMRVMAADNPHTFSKESLVAEVNKLLSDREIIVMHYKIAKVGWRNIYFPKGTEFNVPQET